ncbi:MAG: hypothetical protein R3B70_00870 [Polyangiaceae bacterium]
MPGLVVKSDGVEMGAAMLGTPLFVDPGDHTIEAVAPGYEAYTVTVNVGPNADSKTAAIPPLTKSPEPAPTATATAAASGTTAPDTTAAPTGTAMVTAAPTATATGGGEEGSGMRTASYVLMGVGIAGAAVGGVLGGLAAADVGNAESDPALCPGKVCSPAGRAVINDAGTKALVSTIALPVGLAAAGAGLVLFFVSGPKEQKTGAVRRTLAISPIVTPEGAALSVGGRF